MDMTDNRTDNKSEFADEQLHEQLTTADNELLEQLFRPLRTMEVADDGFTQRVMQRLPRTADAELRSVWLSRLWTLICVVVALLLFVALKGWYVIGWSIITMLNNPPSMSTILTLFAALALTVLIATTEVVHRYNYSF
jgi:hypothetical protein